MATVTAPSTTTIPAYPATAVTTALRKELLVAVRAEAARKAKPLPPSDDDLAVAEVPIDSLSVVEILCILDDILPFEVGESVVRAGGYNSIAAAVKHVVQRIESKWAEHYRAQP